MSRSVKAITISRNKKFKSANMLQARRLAINVDISDEIKIGQLTSFAYKNLDVAALLTSSTMHLQLSTCFDQYKVLNYVVKFSLKGNIGGDQLIDNNIDDFEGYGNLFTLVDRTKIKDVTSIDALRSYQSFREILLPLDGSKVTDYKRQVICSGAYTDTKTTATLPLIYYGMTIPEEIVNRLTFNFNINIKFDVIYRGPRYDMSYVSTRINPMIQSIMPAATTIDVVRYSNEVIIDRITLTGQGVYDKEIDMDAFTYLDQTQAGYATANEAYFIIKIYKEPTHPGYLRVIADMIGQNRPYQIYQGAWAIIDYQANGYRTAIFKHGDIAMFQLTDNSEVTGGTQLYIRAKFPFIDYK